MQDMRYCTLTLVPIVYLPAAQVSVYDLRTLRIRKTLQADGDKSQCVSMAFSHDSNLLLTQGGAPEWTLVLWNWAKARQLAKIRASETLPVYQVYKAQSTCFPTFRVKRFVGPRNSIIALATHLVLLYCVVSCCLISFEHRYSMDPHCEQVSFNPVDASLACVSGNSTFHFYRVAEGDLRPMTAPRVKEHNFLSHSWLKQPEDHLILGTETGQLVLFRSGDFVCYLVCAPGGNTKVTVLLSFSQVRFNGQF